MRFRGSFLSSLSLSLVVCVDGCGGGGGDAAADASVDSGGFDVHALDSASDSNDANVIVLLDPVELVPPQELDVSDRVAQINGSALRVGGAVWMIYSAAERRADAGVFEAGAPDTGIADDAAGREAAVDAELDAGFDASTAESGGGLSIWLTRTNLQNVRQVAPSRIDEFGGNCGSPRLAALGDGAALRLIATWQCSNVPGSSGSFETHYRVFDSTGAPLTADIRLQTRRSEMTLDVHAFPTVAAQTGRGFLLSGSRGVPEIGGGFKGYVQTISAQGLMTEEAFEWNSDRNEQESNPSIGVAGAEFVVVYERASHAFAVREGGAEVDLGVGSQPTVAADPRRTLAAFVRTDARDVVVYDLTTAIRTEPAFRVASVTRAAYTPALAMDGSGGGALIWTRAEGPGARGPILAVRFDASGNVSGEYLVIARSTSFSYSPMFVHLGGDRFLLGWSEGSGANLRLSTSVVELALAQQ